MPKLQRVGTQAADKPPATRYVASWNGGSCMRRRRHKAGPDTLPALPWPVSVAAGIIGFAAVGHVIPWLLSSKGGTLARGFAQHSSSMFSILAWMLLVLCWIAALSSYLAARKRRRFLDTRTNLDSLAEGGWCRFEQLVGEAFRRQGYVVEETGLGGPDGGIDLILRKDGRRTLVQCKQWKRQQVGVSVVREMAGLLAHHQAHAIKIACIGSFTADAEAFARGKPIELIDGQQLLAMIQSVKAMDDPSTSSNKRVEPVTTGPGTQSPKPPTCPRCGYALVQRVNRTTGQAFLGCSNFPNCRGTSR